MPAKRIEVNSILFFFLSLGNNAVQAWYTKTMIKFIRIFLLVLIIIGLGLLATQKMWLPKITDMIVAREMPPIVIPAPVVPEKYNITDGRKCYAYSHSATTDAPYEVNEWLDVTVSGGQVTGTKSGTQKGPDMSNGYQGSISGSVEEGILNAVFAYTVEGSSNKEQEIYHASKDGLEKYRYPLIEKDGMLVPDISKEYTKLKYAHTACKQSTDFEGEADPSRMKLDMKIWKWIRTDNNDGTVVVPRQKDKFNLTIKNDKTFSATTDCNGVGGEYMLKGSLISFERMMSTLMYCEGSQEAGFSGMLSTVQRYHFTSNGELVLEFKFDSGSMIFK